MASITFKGSPVETSGELPQVGSYLSETLGFSAAKIASACREMKENA